MYRYLTAFLFLFFACSCESSYEEKTNYTVYYDNEMKKKKVEGNLYNGEETGEWLFYAEEGYISRRGYYDNGLPVLEWTYSLPYIDSAITWRPVDLDTLNFSLPATFKQHSGLKSTTVAYRDTLTHSLLGIHIVKDCNDSCVNDYYNINLQEFVDNGMEVLYSQSRLVESKSGSYYIDEYNIRRADYQKEIKLYMVYKSVGNNELLVLSITNEKEYEPQIKFLIGEIFYHFKYRYKRIAFPYEEITNLSNVGGAGVK